MRDLPRDPRYGRVGADRAGPDTHRDAQHPRRGDSSQHSREPRRVDSGPAAREAGQSDAAKPTRRRGPSGHGGVSGNAAMTDSQALEHTWADPKGVYGWFMH